MNGSRSLVYNIIRREPRTDPCGTPQDKENSLVISGECKVLCFSALRPSGPGLGASGDVRAGGRLQVQVLRGGGRRGRPLRLHVWVHVPHAAHRVRYGAGRTHLQVNTHTNPYVINVYWPLLSHCP